VVFIPPRAAVALSLRGAVQLGLVPGTAPGLALASSLLPVGRWGFSVHAEYTPSRPVERGIGSLEIGLTRASALATFHLVRGERVRWSTGAGPSFGALHLAVRAPAPVTDPGDYWLAAVQLETAVQLHVTDGLFLELGAGAVALLLRQEFLVRGQGEPVWSQSRIAGSLFGGVGTLFP
jgi:hypothetical protein